MRWEGLQIGHEPAALFGTDVVVRQFDTPQFRGITFYEVRARSVLNQVPKVSQVPFRWTVNPYRGCSHACVYCFARNTHTYLDLDAGADFDSRIVVKVNAGERLRQELAAPTWCGEHVAMGTNVDCYQRAEGRYQLMPPILRALRDAANPFSILTKAALVLRDLPLLQQAAEVAEVSVNVSVGFVDERVWRRVEPGTPSPRRRLDVVRRLRDAGLRPGVLMAPILPYLTDSDEQLATTVAAIAEAGAESVTPIVLHLRPGTREWYAQWLAREYPALVGEYQRLYGRGSYAPKAFQRRITGRVHDLAVCHGLVRHGGGAARHVSAATPVRVPAAEQLVLL